MTDKMQGNKFCLDLTLDILRLIKTTEPLIDICLRRRRGSDVGNRKCKERLYPHQAEITWPDVRKRCKETTQ